MNCERVEISSVEFVRSLVRSSRTKAREENERNEKSKRVKDKDKETHKSYVPFVRCFGRVRCDFRSSFEFGPQSNPNESN